MLYIHSVFCICTACMCICVAYSTHTHSSDNDKDNLFNIHDCYTDTTGQIGRKQPDTTCSQLLKNVQNNIQDNVKYNPFLINIPLLQLTNHGWQLPEIQNKAINILKPPKTQVSYVKKSIIHLVKITVQRPSIYFCSLSKLTQITELPSIIVTKKLLQRIKSFVIYNFLIYF
jgi:hypothetical protein